MSGFVLREARREDAAVLAALMRRLFVASYAHSADAANLARFLELSYGDAQQARELADAGLATLVAEEAGNPIGFMQVRPRSPCPARIASRAPAELVRIYVDSRVHGRGVGPALMAEAVRRASEAGADALWLYAWQRAERALAFYRKFGFRIVGTSVFMVGDKPTDDWVMARALESGAAQSTPSSGL